MPASTQPIDEAAILALNRAHVAATSALEAAELRALLEQAFHVGASDRGRAAFLVALEAPRAERREDDQRCPL